MKTQTKAALVLVVLVAFLMCPFLIPFTLVLVQSQPLMDPLAAAWAVEFFAAIVQLVGTASIIGILYLLPVVVAVMRKHPDALAISALTILLGWSVVGWAIALVWAFRKQQPQVIVPPDGRFRSE